MKKFILGFILALVLIGLIYFGYSFIRGLFGESGGPVSPENLNPAVKDYGSLQVEVFAKGNPVSDVEVDLGTMSTNGPKGPMSYAITDTTGVASFSKVPVGNFNIFFNLNHFPTKYTVPTQESLLSVEIVKDQLVKKRINLELK